MFVCTPSVFRLYIHEESVHIVNCVFLVRSRWNGCGKSNNGRVYRELANELQLLKTQLRDLVVTMHRTLVHDHKFNTYFIRVLRIAEISGFFIARVIPHISFNDIFNIPIVYATAWNSWNYLNGNSMEILKTRLACHDDIAVAAGPTLLHSMYLLYI